MTWQRLLEADVQKFVCAHADDDVRALALKKPPNVDWDYPLVLAQIQARQKAVGKIPDWLAHEGVVFPPSDVMEQASSMATARYKAELVRGARLVDLTGGVGVDFLAMVAGFERGAVVERDEIVAGILAHNVEVLSDGDIEVVYGDASDYVERMGAVDCVMIDPQRRDVGRKGRFKFEDCSPNVLALLPALLEKSETIIIKTSPMLDIAQGIEQLGHVQSVHVVEWCGDCKELVFVLGRAVCDAPDIHAVALDDEGGIKNSLVFTLHEEKETVAPLSEPLRYLYEPSAAFQKSGAFNVLAARYEVQKLHAHTHLYTSTDLRPDFPGRMFEIMGDYAVRADKALPHRAHITTRNFPMAVEDLRRKLKIKDGGDEYLFACTLMDGQKRLIHGRKVQS